MSGGGTGVINITIVLLRLVTSVTDTSPTGLGTHKVSNGLRWEDQVINPGHQVVGRAQKQQPLILPHVPLPHRV